MYKSYLRVTKHLFQIILSILFVLVSISGNIRNVSAKTSIDTINSFKLNQSIAVRENNVYDNTDNEWNYNGSWSEIKIRKAFKGKVHVSNTPGNDASITFTGSKFVLIYTRAPEYGKLDIYVDGEKIETINQKNSKTSHQKEWVSPPLGWGEHTVKFVHKNGEMVNIDAFKIRGGNSSPKTQPSETPVNTDIPSLPDSPTATNTVSGNSSTATFTPSATTIVPSSTVQAPASAVSPTATSSLQTQTLTTIPSVTPTALFPSPSSTLFMSPTVTSVSSLTPTMVVPNSIPNLTIVPPTKTPIPSQTSISLTPQPPPHTTTPTITAVLTQANPVLATPTSSLSPIQMPYNGKAWIIPGTIQAEDFDNGGEGVAYYDTTSSNEGNQYRKNEAVDIETTLDSGGGHNIGWVKASEWYEYTVNVTTSGSYSLNLRLSNTAGGGSLHVEVDGVNVTGLVSVPNTGGFQIWQTVTKNEISLSAGEHVIRLSSDTASTNGYVGNINSISFSLSTSTIPSPTVTMVATSTPTNNTHYVSPSGSDNNPGTQALPWRTIQKAANSASPGDTVVVFAGIYNERVIASTPSITFQAKGQVQVIRFSIRANNVTIEGFVSKNNDSNSGAFECIASGCIIKNNKIENSCMAGIILKGNDGLAENNIISKSRQCDGSGSDADGIRVFNDGNKIIGNHVSNISLAENPTAHIDCIQSWGTLTNTLIHGNFCDTAHAGVQTDSGYSVQGITITENKFIASRPLNVYGDGLIVMNNVFIGRTITGFNGSFISFRDSKNIIFTNNIILNTTDGILTQVGATILGGNNVFWNDSGLPPRRDSGYNGNPSSLKWASDKWQTVNPLLDANYFTGNQLVCYAGLGCFDG